MAKASYRLWLCTGGIVAAGLAIGVAVPARAGVTLTGQLSDVSFGAPLSTQTIDTGFGDSTSGDGQSVGGSELDAAYATIQNGNLYVFISGNLEAAESTVSGSSANHVVLFIDAGVSGGENVLTAGSSGYLSHANGSTFSPGFNATFAIDSNDYQNTLYTDEYSPIATSAGSYIGSAALSSNGKPGVTTGVGGNQNLNTTGIAIGFNDTNVTVTPNGTTGVALTNTQAAAANAATTGIDYGIPLSVLGSPTGTIKLMAMVEGAGDGYASNQFLPGLPVGTGDLGDGTEAYSLAGVGAGFNLSTLPTNYFTINVPAAQSNGTWLPPGGGTWGSSGNWANGAIPGKAGDAASFSSATGAAVVTLDGNRTVGTVTFSNVNSYTIAQGTGGSLILDGNGSDAIVTDFGGTHTISAPVILHSNTDVGVVNHGDILTISGNISGTGALNVTNLGNGGGNFNPSAVVLSGSNSYSGGTSVSRGTLQMGSATALPTGTALTLAGIDSPAGQLDMNGFNATISSLSTTGGLAAQTNISTLAGSGNSTLTFAGTNSNPSTFPGNISDSSASGGSTLSLTVASGKLTLSGTNSYAGSTTINSGGSLVLLSATGAGTSFPFGGNVANNGSLELNDSLAIGVTGTGTTTVDAGMTLTALAVNQGALVNNGTVNLASGSGNTVGSVNGTGALTINASLEIVPSGGVSQQTSLALGSSATLALDNNRFIVNYGSGNPSPLATIQAALSSGQITSSAPAKGYGFGISDNGSSVAFGDTLVGDVNVDGSVNLTDLLDLLNSYGQSGKDWAQGDTNGDGSVNLTDLLNLLNNYGQSDQITSLSGTQVVPEPATMSLLSLGAGSLLMRRRRHARQA
jgi:fibronectin-binding autotransporter adhesin